MGNLGSQTVLIVEDEWLVRMELAHAFKDEGCTVLESASAEDALVSFGSSPDITLLVTDIRLSGRMTGWDLADRARRLNPAVAVIYISANPAAPERHVSGSVFIDKPALIADVLATARTVLAN